MVATQQAQTGVRFSRESNMPFLPFVYFLPEDLISKCPTLRKLPRCLGEVAKSEKCIDLINSDAFLNEIMDASAALAFPHFGFSGWKENYTGYCPVWKLSYSIRIWARLLEEETGWGVKALLKTPPTQYIPFLNPEYVKEVMSRVVKRAISEQNWQPILDVVKKMPCDEDFEEWKSNVRTSFYRKWYHSRSKIKSQSYEKCMAWKEHEIHKLSNETDIAASVEADDYYGKFKARLSERDLAILELRAEGYPYEEIAAKLGYQNHSGVLKRMRAITKAFVKYEEENEVH